MRGAVLITGRGNVSGGGGEERAEDEEHTRRAIRFDEA
jgi:hypothetical protein